MALPVYNEKTILVEASKLAPKDAIKYFEAKGFKITWDWRETLNSANNKVFQVAKAGSLDVLKDLKNGIDSALKNGDTFRTFQNKVQPLLNKKGWTGIKEVRNPKTGKLQRVELGTPRRLKTIYSTNIQSSFNAGRWEQQNRSADFMPYLKLIEVLDGTTRPTHREMSGSIAKIDDPFWNTWYPPNGFNCRGRTMQLTTAEAEEQGIEIQDEHQPDEGFQNNVGKTDFKPSKKDHDPALWNRAEKMKPLKALETPKSIADPTKYTPAKTVKEAESWARLNGSKFADFKGMSLDHANNINQAIFTVGGRLKSAIPDFIGTTARYKKATGQKVASKFFGMATKADLNLYPNKVKTLKEIKEGQDKTIVVIESRKYKTTESVTKKKRALNNQLKEGGMDLHYFNDDGRSTVYHEFGHIFDFNNNISKKREWFDLAENWYNKTKFGSIVSRSHGFSGTIQHHEAFAEAFADWQLNNGKRLPKEIVLFLEKMTENPNTYNI